MDELEFKSVPGPVILFTPPTRQCSKHGSHTAWVQFRWEQFGEHPDHYCILCIVDQLNVLGIGRASDNSDPATDG